MRRRLNVTEQERLRYSSRRLRALSALRNAGIAPRGGLEKTARSSATGRLGYRVVLSDGSDWHCERLVDVETLAVEFALWARARRQPRGVSVSFPVWQADARQRMWALVVAGLWQAGDVAPVCRVTDESGTRAGCAWAGCRSLASGLVAGQALCAVHAWAYGQQHFAGQQSAG